MDKHETRNKHLVRGGVMGLTLASLILPAHAIIIASDDFTYTDGGLAGNSGGTGWASAWEKRTGTGDATDAVASGVASVSGDNSDVFDDQGASYRNLAATVDPFVSTDIWITFDMAFTQGASTSSFVALTFRTGDPGATGDPTDRSFRIGQDWATSNWVVVAGGGAGTSADTGILSSTGTLDTLLVHIDVNNFETSLWVNAADGVPLGVADAVVGEVPNSFDTVMFRSGGSGATLRENTFDNLVIATTEAEVRLVPEPSSAALIGLGGLAFMLRRRK